MGLKDIFFKNGDADWQEIKAAFREVKEEATQAAKDVKADYREAKEAANPFNGAPVVTVTLTGLRTLSTWDREAAKYGYYRVAASEETLGLRTLTYRLA